MELLSETIENYFSNLNPIARKIHFDINEIKSSYEHIWKELSPNEQKDIINETLIKPEIALRYFDSFTSLSTGSLSSGTAIDDDVNTTKSKLNDQSTIANLYSYDNKNLSTYSAQKTGLKIIHDEVAGIFRDEHSAPFSFKTKSQINLHIFSTPSKNLTDIPIKEYPHPPLKQQKIPTKNLIAVNHSPQVPNDSNLSGKYERFYDDTTLCGIDDLKDGGDIKGNFFSKFICKNSLIFNAGASIMVKSAQNVDNEEGETLMNDANCASGMASSLSVPFDEEEDKPAYEDSKLLLETDDLRKGFDFLNNW